MEENTTDKPRSQTGRQTPTWSGYGMIGGTGLMGPMKLTDTGTTVLPTVAALRGSGSMEGRNSYDYLSPSTPWGGAMGFGLGLLGVNGTGQRWPGDYITYRTMIRYPVIALVRAAVFTPIMAAKWSLECEDDAPKDAEELIEDAIFPMRIDLVRPMLRALDFGFAPLELMWGTSDDGWKVPSVRELLPDITQIEVGEDGQIIRLKNNGNDLNAPEFAIYTYEREADNWYGIPRLENLRRTWANLLTAEDKLARLEGKASGILPRIYHPADFQTPANPQDSNRNKALTALAALLNGNGIAMEYPLPPIDSLERAPDLAKHRLVDIDLLDMGNCGPSQEALMKRIDMLQRDCVRGYLRSERTVIEAQTAGSRADAEEHSASISDTATDQVHADIVDAINKWVVGPMLEENFGPKYRDSVRIVPREVVDESKLVDQKILDALLQNPSSAAELIEQLDMQGWAYRVGLKSKQDANWDEPDWKGAANPNPDPMDAESKMQDEADKARKELSAALFSEQVVA